MPEMPYYCLEPSNVIAGKPFEGIIILQKWVIAVTLLPFRKNGGNNNKYQLDFDRGSHQGHLHLQGELLGASYLNYLPNPIKLD